MKLKIRELHFMFISISKANQMSAIKFFASNSDLRRNARSFKVRGIVEN